MKTIKYILNIKKFDKEMSKIKNQLLRIQKRYGNIEIDEKHWIHKILIATKSCIEEI